MFPTQTIQGIEEAKALFQSDALTLTPNNRLARHLEKHINELNIRDHITTWETPNVLPLQTWLERTFKDSSIFNPNTQLLLSATQEQQLWKNIVDKHNVHSLINTEACIANIIQAWEFALAWHLDWRSFQHLENVDAQTFSSWAYHFSKDCEKNNFITKAELPDYLLNHFDVIKQIPSVIYLYQFIELAPNIKNLLEMLESSGVKIIQLKLEQAPADTSLLPYANIDLEISAMTTWAKQQYEQNPFQQIACIIPNLGELRPKLIRAFYKAFNREQQDVGDLPFNISSGEKLHAVPIMFTAFALLQFKKYKINQDVLSHLLRSPYSQFATHPLTATTELLKRLNEAKGTEFSLKQLLNKTNDLEELSKLLQEIDSIELPKKATASEWAALFSSLLKTVSWPGARSLSSKEYQATQQWMNLLDLFSELDAFKAMNFSDALNQLQTLATQTIFQAQTLNPSIHVLGVLEASGIDFDRIWIMSMDQSQWPTKANPNPFIPYSIQKQFQIPHATAERELHFCRTITKQWLQSAKHVLFSYAENQGDNHLSVSPLICHINIATLEQPKSDDTFKPTTLESIEDFKAPSLTSDDKIKGGSSLLKQQAACPFRAFAEFRLKLKPLEKSEPGIDARDRGNFIHKVLELFWQEIQTQAQLLSLNDDELNTLLEQCINTSAKQHLFALEKNQRKIEIIRVKKLLQDWMEIEKSREPFVVAEQEVQHQINIGKLTLNTRVDRVDQTEANQSILIDYKTGKASIKDWLDERPDEPQLPLYAINTEHLSGLAFAQIRRDELRFKGFTKPPTELIQCKPLKSDIAWEEQMLNWKYHLEQLANQFYEGEASVSPKNGEQTCRYCAYKTLCRITEKN